MKSISMVTREEDKDLNQVLFATVVAKDQYLFPTPTWRLASTCNLSSRGPGGLVWTLVLTLCIYTHEDIHIHIGEKVRIKKI